MAGLTQRKQILFSSGLLALLLVAVSFATHTNREGIWFPFWQKSTLENFQLENGFAYIAPTHQPEQSGHEHPSLAQLLEDGRPLLGFGNALHNDIRKIGGGRYSFWYGAVYFASSDNSDPRANGRRYEIYYPWMAGKSFARVIYGLTLIVFIFSGGLAVRARQLPEIAALTNRAKQGARFLREPPFYLSAALLGAVFLVTRLPFFIHYPVVGIAPDTVSFWAVVETAKNGHFPQFIIRAPGYPLFVGVITAISDRWMTVVLVQNLMSLGSSLGLIYAIHQFRRTLAFPAAIAMCGFIGSTQVLIYDTYALSDGLFSNSIIASVALLILAFTNPRPRRYFAWASAAMAWTILVRPSGMYFIVIYALVIAYLLWNRCPKAALLHFLVPLPVMLWTLCFYNYFTLGNFGISSHGEASLGSATILFWEPDPEFPEFVNQALQKLPDAYTAAGISREDLQTFRTSWDPDLLYPIFTRSYNPVAVQQGWAYGSKFGDGDYLRNKKYIMQVARKAIIKHPDLYAKFFWINTVIFFNTIQYKFDLFAALTFRAKQNYAATDRGYDVPSSKEYVTPHPPPEVLITGTGDNASVTLTPTFLGQLEIYWQSWHWKIFQQQVWFWIFLIVFVAGVIRLIFARGHHVGAALVCLIGLMVFGACSLVCLVELGIERYSYPTQFIYYLSPVLLPLLWSPAEKIGSPANPSTKTRPGIALRLVGRAPA